MSSVPVAPQLSSFALLTRGYFHDRVIPPLDSSSLALAFHEIQPFVTSEFAKATQKKKFGLKTKRSRLCLHSVPKRKHLRRMLAIPNPLLYAITCEQLVQLWPDIYAICNASPFSMSVPTPSPDRAVQSPMGQRAVATERAKRSVGKRFVLKTDLVRYYPSIYTHSIPWAIHGKDTARDDLNNDLPGNRLDVCVREMQDRQTGGIPIGPDTSYIIGEVIASKMDRMLVERLPGISFRGTRFVDDYHLYFASRGDAEQAIAALHNIARSFELEINDAKTEIDEVPEPIEPSWKTVLRTYPIANDDHGTSCRAIFDRAAELAGSYPSDSVYTYVAKKVQHAGLPSEIWEICEPLLLRAAASEPSMLPTLLRVFDTYYVADASMLADTLNALVAYHAPLQHNYEVAWSLWIASRYSIQLAADVLALAAQTADDIVALVCLDLRHKGLASGIDTRNWDVLMREESLYSEHWLLAYEALHKGWLDSVTGKNYLEADEFFAILEKRGVTFYDESTTEPTEEPHYSGDFGEEDSEVDLDLDDESPGDGDVVTI